MAKAYGTDQSSIRKENRYVNAPIWDRILNYADNQIQRNNHGDKGVMNPNNRDNKERAVIIRGIN